MKFRIDRRISMKFVSIPASYSISLLKETSTTFKPHKLGFMPRVRLEKGPTLARGDSMSKTILEKSRETTLDQHYYRAFSSCKVEKNWEIN